jgi:hypothetical protein
MSLYRVTEHRAFSDRKEHIWDMLSLDVIEVAQRVHKFTLWSLAAQDGQKTPENSNWRRGPDAIHTM